MTERLRAARWALVAVLVLAIAVRLWGITFALPHVLARPDELFVLGIAIRMHQGFTNPEMFDYPSVYLYVVAGLFTIYYAWGFLTGRFSGPADFVEAFSSHWTPFFLIGRVVNAVLGAATAGMCYAIARPIFGPATGLVSAFFMALAFLHVRDSHYATTDIPLTFFVTCAMVAVVRVHEDRKTRDAWLAGVFAGLAIGVKYSAAPVVIPLAAVECVHAWRGRHNWRLVLRETHLWRMALASAAIFVATSPYLLLDFDTARTHLEALAGSTATGMTPPELLGRGWTYHLPVSLRHGLGVPLLASGLGGLAWMFVRRPALALILGCFPIAYYAAAGAGYNVFVRYMIPVVPFLCIFAAYAVTEVAAVVASKNRTLEIAAASVLAVAIVFPSAVSVVRFDRLLTQEDSRLIAARWIHEHVPPGTSIFLAGNLYGQPQLEPPNGKYRIFGWDRRSRRFLLRERIEGRPRQTVVDEEPEVIVVQRSALPYSHLPPAVAQLIDSKYQLVHIVRAANLAAAGNVYDIQDGFYAPFAGFKGVERPGPNVEIYRIPNP